MNEFLKQILDDLAQDITMALIGVGLVGASVYLWIQGSNVPDVLAGLDGVIVAYFYGRRSRNGNGGNNAPR